MVLSFDARTGVTGLFESEDGKTWSLLQELGTVDYDIGDAVQLLEMPVLGPHGITTDTTKWVVMAAKAVNWRDKRPDGAQDHGIFYLVGDFDGKKFRPDVHQNDAAHGYKAHVAGWGDGQYAHSFRMDDGESRVIQQIRLNQEQATGEQASFVGIMGVPVELSLQMRTVGNETEARPVLCRTPVKELETLRGDETRSVEDLADIEVNVPNSEMRGPLKLGPFTYLHETNEFHINLEALNIGIDEHAILPYFNLRGTSAAEDGGFRMRFLFDRNTLEIFSPAGDFSVALVLTRHGRTPVNLAQQILDAAPGPTKGYRMASTVPARRNAERKLFQNPVERRGEWCPVQARGLDTYKTLD